MKNKWFLIIILLVLIIALGLLLFIANNKNQNRGTSMSNNEDKEENNTLTDMQNEEDRLLYQGKASIRIVTREGKVIYIDPYIGDGYELSADLILVTHEHFDHNAIDKVKNRNKDCKIIRSKDAVINGVHQKFELGYATVEAVEAGYNSYHDVNNCAGYVVTLSDGISIYVTGDTSITKQMPELAQKNIDYAFFCCDGIYNMGLEEAIQATNYVKAKHSIPYHMTASTNDFDRDKAERFDVEGKLIIENGQEIILEKKDNNMSNEEEDVLN